MKLITVMPVLVLAATVGLTACATTPSSTLVPGSSYNATPPRLVQGGSGESNDFYACTSPFPDAKKPPQFVSAEFDCKDTTKRTRVSWDRPDFFGPVPQELQKQAQAACDQLGPNRRPTGYHPAAQYFDGTTSPTGGYYCERVGSQKR